MLHLHQSMISAIRSALDAGDGFMCKRYWARFSLIQPALSGPPRLMWRPCLHCAKQIRLFSLLHILISFPHHSAVNASLSLGWIGPRRHRSPAAQVLMPFLSGEGGRPRRRREATLPVSSEMRRCGSVNLQSPPGCVVPLQRLVVGLRCMAMAYGLWGLDWIQNLLGFQAYRSQFNNLMMYGFVFGLRCVVYGV